MGKLKIAAVGAGIVFGAKFLDDMAKEKGWIDPKASYAKFSAPGVGAALAVAAHFAGLL